MNNNEKCYCNDKHAMVITQHSASRIICVIILAAFFVFVLGYFIGKKNICLKNQNTYLKRE